MCHSHVWPHETRVIYSRKGAARLCTNCTPRDIVDPSWVSYLFCSTHCWIVPTHYVPGILQTSAQAADWSKEVALDAILFGGASSNLVLCITLFWFCILGYSVAFVTAYATSQALIKEVLYAWRIKKERCQHRQGHTIHPQFTLSSRIMCIAI